MRLPGMLHGRVVRPPRYGAKLDSFDEATVKAMPGVVAVVRDGSFLGVVAEREEQAIKARAALADVGALVRRQRAARSGQALRAPAVAADARTRSSARSRRRSRPAPRCSRRPITGPTWRMPRSGRPARSPQLQDGKLTVWTHSQGVFPLRATMAKALDMPAAAIRCIHAEGAGCYGHNGADDVALDAALLARATDGRPVRVQWMRDDEFMWEPYGPAMTMQARARPRGRPHRRLDLRRLEPEPQHAAGRSRRRQPAGELVPGEAEAAGAAAHGAAARRAPATATPSRSTICRASASPTT